MRFKMYAFTAVAATTAAMFVAGTPLGAEGDINGDPYTLDVCSVSGEKLGAMGDPIVRAYNNREVRFCCEGCLGLFEEEQAKYFSIIDKLMIGRQKAHYPLETSVVTGEQLAANSIDAIVNNRLVRFGNAKDQDTFNANPAKYLAKLDEAVIAKQSAGYPFDVCPVSGEKLADPDKVINLVLANRLVKLCCPMCVEKVTEDPTRFFAMLDSGKLDAKAEEGSDSKEEK